MRRVLVFMIGLVVLPMWLPTRGVAATSSARRPVMIGVAARSGRQLWRAAINGGRPASLRVSYVADGVIIVQQQRCLSDDRAEYRPGDIATVAFDAATGEQLWNRSDAAVSHPGFASFGYQASGGVVLVQTTNGRLEALKLRTGEVRWQKSPTEPPTFGGNLVYGDQFGIMGTVGDLLLTSNVSRILTTGGEPRLEAWSLQTGEEVWSADLGPDPLARFASDGHDLLVLRQVRPTVAGNPTAESMTHIQSRVDTLSLDDGTVLGSIALGTSDLAGLPLHLVATTTAFVSGSSTNPGRIVGGQRTSGTVQWELHGLLKLGIAGTVFVSDPTTGEILARDASTGAPRWQRRGSDVSASTNDTVVVSDFDQRSGQGIVGVDIDTGSRRWNRRDAPLGFGGTTRGVSVLSSSGCPTTAYLD